MVVVLLLCLSAGRCCCCLSQQTPLRHPQSAGCHHSKQQQQQVHHQLRHQQQQQKSRAKCLQPYTQGSHLHEHKLPPLQQQRHRWCQLFSRCSPTQHSNSNRSSSSSSLLVEMLSCWIRVQPLRVRMVRTHHSMTSCHLPSSSKCSKRRAMGSSRSTSRCTNRSCHRRHSSSSSSKRAPVSRCWSLIGLQ